MKYILIALAFCAPHSCLARDSIVPHPSLISTCDETCFARDTIAIGNTPLDTPSTNAKFERIDQRLAASTSELRQLTQQAFELSFPGSTTGCQSEREKSMKLAREAAAELFLATGFWQDHLRGAKWIALRRGKEFAQKSLEVSQSCSAQK
jgi:hypothetical protein